MSVFYCHQQVTSLSKEIIPRMHEDGSTLGQTGMVQVVYGMEVQGPKGENATVCKISCWSLHPHGTMDKLPGQEGLQPVI